MSEYLSPGVKIFLPLAGMLVSIFDLDVELYRFGDNSGFTNFKVIYKGI